ncbi:hypothetical protein HDU76_009516 [Blyttiomyces sp. JEL0837]|nr:hypothetical protein HDU76_009516 [Blyttiomyces sp. JEL0837]
MLFTAASLIALVVSAIAQPVVQNLDKDIVADLSLYAKKDATPFSVSTLLSIVSDPSQKAVLDVLAGAKGDITLFAPTDAAFANLPRAVNTSDAALITQVLQYHASSGAPFIPKANGDYFIDTLLTSDLVGGAEPVRAVVSDNGVTLTFGRLLDAGFTANVVQSDVILGGKGVIHFVDQVLIPPQTASKTALAAEWSQFISAIMYNNLTDTIDNAKKVTILVPTNDAFNAIAEVYTKWTPAQKVELLTLHVISGIYTSKDLLKTQSMRSIPTLSGNSTLSENNSGDLGRPITFAGPGNMKPSTVTLPDIFIANGVAHVIDTVLLPIWADPLATSTATYTPKPTSTSVLYNSGERVAPASFAAAAIAALAAMAI